MKKIIVILGLFLISACSQEITTFQECAAAGNPIMESYPRQCRANDQTFVEELSEEEQERLEQPICVDQCGNGQCAEIVCQGTGCPCAESKETCPEDCS